jgi:hypothetical protein
VRELWDRTWDDANEPEDEEGNEGCHSVRPYHFSSVGFAEFVIQKHGTVDIWRDLRRKVDEEYKPDWDVEIERLQELLDVAESETSHRLPDQIKGVGG